MAFNALWPRWIEASIVKHLVEGLTAAGITVKPNLEACEAPSDKYIDFVLDGPVFIQRGPDEFDVSISVTILIEYKVTTNIYESADAVGTCISLLQSIPVFNYGQTVTTQLGCLIPDPTINARDWLSRDNGVANKLDIHQRTVECTLTMELSNG
jgi:hypothetical protein